MPLVLINLHPVEIGLCGLWFGVNCSLLWSAEAPELSPWGGCQGGLAASLTHCGWNCVKVTNFEPGTSGRRLSAQGPSESA